jgi:hypothetical protein
VTGGGLKLDLAGRTDAQKHPRISAERIDEAPKDDLEGSLRPVRKASPPGPDMGTWDSKSRFDASDLLPKSSLFADVDEGTRLVLVKPLREPLAVALESAFGMLPHFCGGKT